MWRLSVVLCIARKCPCYPLQFSKAHQRIYTRDWSSSDTRPKDCSTYNLNYFTRRVHSISCTWLNIYHNAIFVRMRIFLWGNLLIMIFKLGSYINLKRQDFYLEYRLLHSKIKLFNIVKCKIVVKVVVNIVTPCNLWKIPFHILIELVGIFSKRY